MKTLARLAPLIAALLLPSAPAHAESATTALPVPIRHNPFRRLADSPLATDGTAAPVAAEWKPTLRGVLRAGPNSLADVDGQMVAIGEKLDGHRLLSVSDYQAVFEKEGRRVILDMRRPQEPRP